MNRSYLVKVVAGESDSSRVWNPRKPMIVGHPLRWVIEQADEGVRVRSIDGAGEHFVKNSEIEKVAAITLGANAKEKDSGLRLELRPVNTVDPAFMNESASANALRVFVCKADWVMDSSELFKTFVARAEGKKVFTLSGNKTGFYSSADSIELKARVEGVRFGKKEMKKGEKLSIPFSEVSGKTISYGDSEWRIASFNRDPSMSVFPVAATADAEMEIIRKTLKVAAIATVAMGVLSWILPASKQEQKDEPVRILLTQKKPKKSGLMTAAPKGDPKAADLSVGKSGSAKNAGRKGNNVADSRNKKVSPAGQKAVAKTAAPKKAAPSKSAPKAAAPKASKKVAKSSARPAARAAKKSVAKRSASAGSARPAPRSELAQALSSASLRKTAAGLLSGGMAGGSARGGDAAAEARALGASSGGSGRGALGGAGGVSTRSASVSGFGGGGSGNGDGGPGSAGAGYGRGSYSKVSGQGKSFVSLDTGASDVDEGLTRDQVGRVIHAHWNEIRYCHESAQVRSPGIGGRLTAKFSIGATGQVQVANVGSSTLGDKALHDCILSRLKGWKFPKPKGGVTVGVAYPFMFKSVTR